MTKTSSATLPKSSHKKKVTKSSQTRKAIALGTCPVNGAGWCAYPFTVEQLERRMKAKLAAQSV
jgi:hypothetical protein